MLNIDGTQSYPIPYIMPEANTFHPKKSRNKVKMFNHYISFHRAILYLQQIYVHFTKHTETMKLTLSHWLSHWLSVPFSFKHFQCFGMIQNTTFLNIMGASHIFFETPCRKIMTDTLLAQSVEENNRKAERIIIYVAMQQTYIFASLKTVRSHPVRSSQGIFEASVDGSSPLKSNQIQNIKISKYKSSMIDYSWRRAHP